MSRGLVVCGACAAWWLASQTASAQPPLPAPTPSPYEVGAGDVLQVLVLGQDTFSGEFTVDAQGGLPFPFLGRIKASGLSTPEIERKLATLLADGYLKRPQVSVRVKEYRSQRVFVTGEVARPGPYGLRPDRSLMTLLRDVGDLTADVGHEVIVIRPPPPDAPAAEAPPATGPAPGNGGEPDPAAGETATEPTPAPEATPTPRPGPPLPGEVPGSELFRLNLRDLRSGYPDKDMTLVAGDTVYFPKAAQIYVTGHVARPGAYRYAEGLTVYQALAQAGSATDRGSVKGVRVIRLVEGKRKEFKLRLDEPLLPEDTVHVPERFF